MVGSKLTCEMCEIGNLYSIENPYDFKAKMFFAQGCEKVVSGGGSSDDDDDDEEEEEAEGDEGVDGEGARD